MLRLIVSRRRRALPSGAVAFWRGPGLPALLFLATGTAHFVIPDFFVGIVPPGLPNPAALVLVSGGAEILGGLGMLWRRSRRAAGVGLVALLIAVFPANVQMLLMARAGDVPAWTELLLWLRLPFQAVIIAWVWLVTRPARPEAAQGRNA